jgi:ParB-like chromosome segregation protein Spo0J
MSQKYFEQLDPKTLRPFSLNTLTFGDIEKDLDEGFLLSIKTRGVDTPVTVTMNGMILSGHRRVAASVKAGHQLIPCMVTDEKDPVKIKQIWGDGNRNREMTQEQRGRYFDALEDIEELLAAERKKHGKKQESDHRENFSYGKAGDIAAEKIGLSRPTAEKISATVAVIDEAEASGDTETAAELRNVLENESASEAARQAKKAKEKLRRAKAAAEKKAAKEAARQAAIDAGGDPDSEPEPEPEPEEEAEPEPAKKPTDKNGKVLPKNLIEIFEKRSLFKDVLNKLTQLQKSYNALVHDDNAYATHKINKVQAQNDLKNFKNLIQFAMPHAICPYCKGTGKDKGGGCTACKGTCWVVETAYKAAPTELR